MLNNVKRMNNTIRSDEWVIPHSKVAEVINLNQKLANLADLGRQNLSNRKTIGSTTIKS
jgi:hypothetical protein